MSIDLFAYRTDPIESVNEGIRWMRAFDAFIERIGMPRLTELMKQGDPLASQKFFREKLLN
jgi:hypothetical protein